MRDRLHRALSVVYGIEPYVILKDIWGLPDREVERTALWMADALIDAALRDAGRSRRAGAAQPTARARELRAAKRVRADDRMRDRARLVRRAVQQPRAASRSIPPSSRTGPRRRRRRAARPGWVLDVRLRQRRRASGSTSFRAPAERRARRCSSTSTAATGARSTSATSAFVAPPFVDAGAMVVLPNYALCPAVSVEHIVLQMVQALAWVHRHAARARRRPAAHRGGRPFGGRPSGDDAAGLRLARVAPDLPADLVKAALSISGVYDLEPLRHAPFLAPDLRPDARRRRGG